MSEVKGPPWSSEGKTVVVKTPAEYAADANGADGLRCPKCNCPRIGVAWRRGLGAAWIRVRVCEHCGQRMQTCESIERLLPPAGAAFDISNQNGGIAGEGS